MVALPRRMAVLLGLELGDRADGAKDLFLHDLHVLADAGEDGRLDEVALFAVALAADFDLGALFPAGIDVSRGGRSVNSVLFPGKSSSNHGARVCVPHNAVELELRHLGALEGVGLPKGSPTTFFLALSLNCVDELVVDALLHVDPESPRSSTGRG